MLDVERTEEAADSVEPCRHDLVVLAQGMIPEWHAETCTPVHPGPDGFVATTSLISPTATSVPGIFVAGAAAGPKDIVDTITEAGAAAMQVTQWLRQQQQQPVEAVV
jgi:heterodisulfide reductase subunit A